jgi:hypothetical protein
LSVPILGFGQFCSREFSGLSLVRKGVGHPCVRLLPRSRLFGLKRNVPRAFGLISHDETLSRDLNQRRTDSFPPIQSLPPAGAQDSFSVAAGVGPPSEPKRRAAAFSHGGR